MPYKNIYMDTQNKQDNISGIIILQNKRERKV